MQSKITNKKRAYVISIILLLTILVLVKTSIAQDKTSDSNKFDENQAITWPENLEKMEGISDDKKNEVWNSASGYVRGYVIKQVSSDIRNQKITEVKQTNTLRNLAGISLLEVPPELKITGFENQKLKWEDKLVIGDSNVQIDLKKIPLNVEEVEYKNGKFIFKFKEGGEIVIGKGSLDEQGNPISIKEFEDRDVKFLFGEDNRENQQFIVDADGRIYFSGNAKVQIEDRVFSVNPNNPDKQAFVSIVGDSHFLTQNARITTTSVVIDTPPNIDTDVFFKQGDFSNYQQYVQVSDGGKAGLKESFIKMQGKDISVEPKKLFNKIIGNGENLKLTNGNFDVVFNGKRTDINRKVKEAKVSIDRIINEQDPKHKLKTETEIKPAEPSEVKPVEPSKVKPAGSKTEAKYESEKWVCIGKFCEITGIFGGDILQKPFDYEVGKGERLIMKTNIYALESEISNLLKETPEGLSKNQFANWASRYLDNLKLVSTIETDWITTNKIEESINEMLTPLNLPKSEMDKVNKFKIEVYNNLARGLTTRYVPQKSRVTLLTNDRGKIYGSFTIRMNNKDYTLKIPGRYFQKAATEKLKKYGTNEKPFSLDELYDKYKKRTVIKKS